MVGKVASVVAGLGQWRSQGHGIRWDLPESDHQWPVVVVRGEWWLGMVLVLS